MEMSDLGSGVGEMVGCASCKSKEMALVGMGFGWGIKKWGGAVRLGAGDGK